MNKHDRIQIDCLICSWSTDWLKPEHAYRRTRIHNTKHDREATIVSLNQQEDIQPEYGWARGH